MTADRSARNAGSSLPVVLAEGLRHIAERRAREDAEQLARRRTIRVVERSKDGGRAA